MNFIKRWCNQGIKFPMAHDVVTGKPSITLFFPYISFVFVIVGLALLMRENILYGTIGAVSVWFVSLVLYLLRKLSKVKAEFDSSPSIELENDDDEKSN